MYELGYLYRNKKNGPVSSSMHREGNKLCIIIRSYMGLCSRSVLFTFTTSCQYKLSKKLVQRIIEAHSVLPS